MPKYLCRGEEKSKDCSARRNRQIQEILDWKIKRITWQICDQFNPLLLSQISGPKIQEAEPSLVPYTLPILLPIIETRILRIDPERAPHNRLLRLPVLGCRKEVFIPCFNILDAYAMTIHKSQGESLGMIWVDIGIKIIY
jgi:hypothetical protein